MTRLVKLIKYLKHLTSRVTLKVETPELEAVFLSAWKAGEAKPLTYRLPL